MAVLIKKIPHKVYQSVGGIGVSGKEREQADHLDSLIEKEIRDLVQFLKNKGIMPDNKGKATLEAYWELGRCIRVATDSEYFVEKAELPLLWINAKLYIPEELIYKERGPYREHLWYCFRLASYPKELANRMKWGEWVTIFDSSGINQELRFDKWFKIKLSKQKKEIGREKIRIFAPCVNTMLGNIEYSELTDSELENCYEAAWHLTSIWAERTNKETSFEKGRKDIQASIISQLGILDNVMDGSMSSYEYAVAILEN